MSSKGEFQLSDLVKSKKSEISAPGNYQKFVFR